MVQEQDNKTSLNVSSHSSVEMQSDAAKLMENLVTPMLFNYGISFLSGSRVIDENSAISTIQQGATFPQVNGVQLVTMSKGI